MAALAVRRVTAIDCYVSHWTSRLDRRSDRLTVYNGNRKLPLIVLLLGLGVLFAPIGFWSTVGIAILGVVIWIANKADMS